MTRKRKGGTGREGGRFIALPHSVMESPAYLRLSCHARALLLEFAFQYRGDDNGRLLCSGNYLSARGWNSNYTITKAKRELLEAGFIHETVKGHRPNKASWYAVTWHTLDRLEGYDHGAAKSFKRGAYRDLSPCNIKALTPSGGVRSQSIAPEGGVEGCTATPSGGAIRERFSYSSTPSGGDPLEKPSMATERTGNPMTIAPAGSGMTLTVLNQNNTTTKAN